MQYQLGFIGGGNMAEAMIRGCLSKRILEPADVVVADPLAARREALAKLNVMTTEDSSSIVQHAQQVVAAVKPQALDSIKTILGGLKCAEQILISIMAGIPIARLQSMLPGPGRIIRVMSNTPLLVGRGMSAVSVGPDAKMGDEALTMKIFEAAGRAILLEEEHLDAVTAVSGSGPAYLFYLAEGMTDAARSLKLPEECVRLMVSQTLAGASELLVESSDGAAELRRRVTSPGGTTQAAIEYMDGHQIKAHVAEAVRKAAERSRELGR